MRDVSIVAVLYCLLFVVLTTPTTMSMFGLSVETVQGLHHFVAELIFWAAALYMCATGTMGAFVRQDRFGLSQNYPLLNRLLSLFLLASPFLALLFNVRFLYVLLGLLALSHVRSKTTDEKKIELKNSRAMSNFVLIIFFTLAMMLMALNDYHVTSIFNFGSTS